MRGSPPGGIGAFAEGKLEDRAGKHRNLLLTLPESDTRRVVAGDAAGDRGKDWSMVAIAAAPPTALVDPPTAEWLGDSPAANASIANFVRAGEQMLTLMDVTWKVGAGLFVLVALAWALGVLPGAVRLF